jgi:voltage-gated potassium channel Kch
VTGNPGGPGGPGAPGSRVGGTPEGSRADLLASFELKDPGYELFIGAVSLLSIANLVLMYAVRDPNLDTVLLVMNALISVILLTDFVYRLATAPAKAHYFVRQFGWADLLSSLPLAQLKLLRLFRLARVNMLLRQRGYARVRGTLLRNRAGSTLLSLLMLGILVLEFGSLWVLALEEGAPDAKITSAPDAIWFVLVTISTVGYGDEFPVTTGGRLVGSVIIVIGVGIFGTFTGFVANRFLAPKPPLMMEDDSTRARVEQLRVLLAQQQAVIDELDGILRKRPRDPDA